MKTIRIGCGAGYQGDRIEPALVLAEKGNINYLVFECLAERTIALAQLEKAKDPKKGYDKLLVPRLEAVLPTCKERGIKIITNMGAANPLAAAEAALACAQSLGLGIKIAVITGDDVLEYVKSTPGLRTIENNTLVSKMENIVSANAYLGAEPIVEALKAGADLVITGRVADPSLFLAPMIHEFGWDMRDWQILGKGTVAAHLLECAGQVTGGYFADPTIKEKTLTAESLANLGFPIAEVKENGEVIITKPEGTGGIVNTLTVSEQLLYEIHNPAAYLTPDVVADFSNISLKEVGNDRVLVSGATGTAQPEMLKVSIGCLEGFIGTGYISYLGPSALDRAKLAEEIVLLRLKQLGVKAELRTDFTGFNSLSRAAKTVSDEVRLRVAGKTPIRKDAEAISLEVERLYTNGPAGGGGAHRSFEEILGISSVLIPRSAVKAEVKIMEA